MDAPPIQLLPPHLRSLGLRLLRTHGKAIFLAQPIYPNEPFKPGPEGIHLIKRKLRYHLIVSDRSFSQDDVAALEVYWYGNLTRGPLHEVARYMFEQYQLRVLDERLETIEDEGILQYPVARYFNRLFKTKEELRLANDILKDHSPAIWLSADEREVAEYGVIEKRLVERYKARPILRVLAVWKEKCFLREIGARVLARIHAVWKPVEGSLEARGCEERCRNTVGRLYQLPASPDAFDFDWPRKKEPGAVNRAKYE